jgi:hypothetical protein
MSGAVREVRMEEDQRAERAAAGKREVRWSARRGCSPRLPRSAGGEAASHRDDHGLRARHLVGDRRDRGPLRRGPLGGVRHHRPCDR